MNAGWEGRARGWLPDVVPPASWAVVMSTGVVSVDLAAIGQPVLSAILLGLAAGTWLVLAAVLGAPLLYRPGWFSGAAASPVSLTLVAATAVLGTCLAMRGYRTTATALLAVAALGWALLVVPVLRHWKTPTTGISFVLGVATDGLALLGVTLAAAYRAGWLVVAAVVLQLLALAFYAFTAARFDLRQLVSGRGDHWVAGGALAISALTAGQITETADALGLFREQHQLLVASTLVLWCLSVAWLIPLVATEVLERRPAYDVRRWATVFPFGMYAACSFTVGRVTGLAAITAFARVWTWPALVATLLALAGLVRSASGALLKDRAR